MKKAIDFFTAHPARLLIFVTLMVGGIMCFLNYIDGANFSWHDLLVEANGVFFDLLVFSTLLYAYEEWKKELERRKEEIEQLHKVIDDYRGWDEKEATHRIVGAIKRLNKLDVSEIDLSDCYLQGADLKSVNFQGANFFNANLQKANLFGTNLQGADLQMTDLRGALLKEANFQSSNLKFANLRGAFFQEANFNGACLWEANFRGTDLRGVNFQRADLGKTNLQEANLRGVNLFLTDLLGADLKGAEVEQNWFENLKKWNTRNVERVKQKYLIDENGVLQEKQ